jgi:hypothetical protein
VNFTANEIHLHLLHAFVLQVFAYGQGAVGTGHSFHLPIHFFHRINLKFTSASLVAKLQILAPPDLPIKE